MTVDSYEVVRIFNLLDEARSMNQTGKHEFAVDYIRIACKHMKKYGAGLKTIELLEDVNFETSFSMIEPTIVQLMGDWDAAFKAKLIADVVN